MTCPTCGLDKRIFVTSWLVWCGKRFTWSQCGACEVRERELADGRAQAAIREAERSGV